MTDAQSLLNSNESQKRRPLWVRLMLGAILLVGLSVLISACGSSGSGDSDDGAAIDPTLLIRLQTACFQSDPPKFYDDSGFCYDVDPKNLTEAERLPLRVLPTPPGATSEDAAGGDTAKPAAPTATAARPAAPTATAAPAAPTATAAPAAPAATSAPVAPTTPATQPETTEAPATTAPPAPPINISAAGGWAWKLTVAAVNGVECIPFLDEDDNEKLPPGCGDQLSGPYNLNFGVVDGHASGSQTVPQLGSKTVTIDGEISPSGDVDIVADMENLGAIAMAGTLAADTCSISGFYVYLTQDVEGTFTLTSNRPGC